MNDVNMLAPKKRNRSPKKQSMKPMMPMTMQSNDPMQNVVATPGYRMFVKSLTDEILKRNPQADKVEMQRIVN